MASRTLHEQHIGTGLINRLTDDLADLASGTSMDAVVPPCPEWSFADLLWHMLEVQHFWTQIVEQRPASPESHQQLPRPEAPRLADELRLQARRLTTVLDAASDADEAWTWVEDPADHTIRFIRRRQTHEILVHLADGCLAAGAPMPEADPLTWADGIDEIVHVNLSDAPDWGTVSGSAQIVELRCADTGDTWQLELGRFTGKSPNSGNDIDLGCTSVVAGRQPTTTVVGAARDLDLWLWGRGPESALTIEGARGPVDELRSIAAEATQ